MPAVQSASVEVVPLQLEDVEVQVTIRDSIAVTEIFGSFINPVGIDLDVMARLPIPRDSELRRFTIMHGDRVLSGALRTTAEANRIFREGRRDHGLVGVVTHDADLGYQLRLSGAHRGETITLHVVCSQRLQGDALERRFVFPEPIEPTGAGSPDGSSDFAEYFPAFSLTARILMPGPIEALNVSGARSLRQVEHSPGSFTLVAEIPGGHAPRVTIDIGLASDGEPEPIDLPFPASATPWLVAAFGQGASPTPPAPGHTWVIRESGAVALGNEL